MRLIMSLTGMGDPRVCDLPDDVVGHEPPGSVVIVWEGAGASVRLVVSSQQLVALCDQVIEYVTVQEERPDGTQPSAN